MRGNESGHPGVHLELHTGDLAGAAVILAAPLLAPDHGRGRRPCYTAMDDGGGWAEASSSAEPGRPTGCPPSQVESVAGK